MGVLGIRERGDSQMRLVNSVRYSKDNEEKDLHKLISKNPSLVALENEAGSRPPTRTIGDKLQLSSGELDLLLVDHDGNLTLVELKRDRAPRDVIAQILDYASDLKQLSFDDLDRMIRRNAAPSGLADAVDALREEVPELDESDPADMRLRVTECLQGKRLQMLIVSYEIPETIRRVADYLRESFGLKIYCVEFDYYEDKKSEFFVPEIIGTEDIKRIERTELTATQKEYQEFYSDLLARLVAMKPGITQMRALPQNWLSIPIGHTGIHLEWAFHGRPRDSFEVGLHFERQTLEENETMLKFFEGQRKELETALGVSLKFECPWGKRWARIFVVKMEGHITDEIRRWAVDTMARFFDVFKPRLDDFIARNRT